MTLNAENLRKAKNEKERFLLFQYHIPYATIANRLFKVWLAIPVYFDSGEKSMNEEWSHNDLIKENNDEENIDTVNAPSLPAEHEKNYKSKQ